MEYILVTGGLGFIGSHVCVELLNNNYHVIVIDNLSNSSKNIKSKIEKLTNRKLDLHIFDLRDNLKLKKIFKEKNIKSVIHLAGLKSVNESIEKPLLYYQTNIITTLNLLSIMEKYNCQNMVFSSSSTVYGNSKLPLTEKSKTGEGIYNPYGQTKYIIENILKDYCNSNEKFNCIILRYFNPIGAHKSSMIGENPNNIPNNLMPYLLKVAIQTSRDNFTDIGDFTNFEKLSIFGDDYDTDDGTCIRDYIHVVDVATAHVKAIQKLLTLNLKFIILAPEKELLF